MTKEQRKSRMSLIISWAMVVIAASTVPVVFGHNVWTFGFQALVCIVAFTKISRKKSAPSRKQ